MNGTKGFGLLEASPVMGFKLSEELRDIMGQGGFVPLYPKLVACFITFGTSFSSFYIEEEKKYKKREGYIRDKYLYTGNRKTFSCPCPKIPRNQVDKGFQREIGVCPSLSHLVPLSQKLGAKHG